MTNTTGWVKLHRQLFDNKIWFLEPFTRGQAWIDLFANANHKESSFFVRGNEIKLKRGQTGWSEITMAKRWTWSRNKVRRFLKWLEMEQQIEQQKLFKLTTIITIRNYDKYQDDTTDDTTERQQKNNRRYTNKNDKNVKNVKNKIQQQKGRINLTKSQLLSFKRQFPVLELEEIREEAKKCSDYMVVSSSNYTNPGLFFRGWLKKVSKEKSEKNYLRKQREEREKYYSQLSEEQKAKNLQKIQEIKNSNPIKGVS